MHHFSSALALAALPFIASANAVNGLYQRDSGLIVTLTPVDNTIVKATVKNVGAESLNLFKYGSLFDASPIEKLSVATKDAPVAFTGMRRSVMRTGLTSEHFETLAAGATYETTINAAAVHDFATGEYTFTAEGAIPYTTGNSTVLSGTAVYFKSNTLTVAVDGAKAALVTKAVDKRAKVTTPCSTAEKSATTKALANCKSLAGAASTAASSGSSSKFSEYFKSTSSSVRSTVAARLSAVASQCGSATSGITYYCEDVYGECESNVLAYTFPSTSVVVNCPLYYSALPNLTGSCHAQDQTTTTLHEFTHAPVVYSPGTQDNGYGYTAATKLSSAQAVLNADSYALYANAIYVGC